MQAFKQNGKEFVCMYSMNDDFADEINIES
jgi:hypothetical protein